MEEKNISPVKEGMEIPALRVQISKVQMMMYAAATWNPYRLHWDSDYARKHGFKDANVAGPMFGAYMAEMLKRWANGSMRLKSLEYTNRAMAFPGDTLICKGTVRRIIKQAGSVFWECQVRVDNQEGALLAEGNAVLATPEPGTAGRSRVLD